MGNSTQTINQLSINIITTKRFIDSEEYFKELSDKFLKDFGLTCIETITHKFAPQGTTLVSILSESHLAIHTWPEKNSIHIDLVSCKKIDSIKVKGYLQSSIPNVKTIEILVDSTIEI